MMCDTFDVRVLSLYTKFKSRLESIHSAKSFSDSLTSSSQARKTNPPTHLHMEYFITAHAFVAVAVLHPYMQNDEQPKCYAVS